MYLYNGQVGNNLRNHIGIMMGFIGVMLCGSRTVFISYVASLSIFMLFSFKLSRKLKFLIIVLLCVVLTYQFLPSVSNSIDRAVDVFLTGGEQVAGSSISMRSKQLVGSYKYFLQNPIIGNGYTYISKELGLGDQDHAVLDKNMQGFESIVFKLMIEQGLLGMLTKIFYSSFILIYYFFVKRQK